MNKSYSKIRHIQEANKRMEKRLLSEQTPFGFAQPKMDQYSDTDFRSSNFDIDKKILSDKKRQIEDIINNFESINCEGINHASAESLYGQRPERDMIYCTSYQGKSKQDLINLLNNL